MSAFIQMLLIEILLIWPSRTRMLISLNERIQLFRFQFGEIHTTK